jgi:hypothetical protein
MAEASSSFLRGRAPVYPRTPRTAAGWDVAEDLIWLAELGGRGRMSPAQSAEASQPSPNQKMPAWCP